MTIEPPVSDPDLVVVWRRDGDSVPRLGSSAVAESISSPVCLLAAGRIANRERLAAEIGRSGEGPDGRLFEELWSRHGPQTPERLAGSFAAVLWDPMRRTLFALRDRLGSQGLYWAEEGGAVLVSRRVAALSRVLERSPRPRVRSLVGHLHARPPVDGETFYESIRAVEPAGLLEIGRDRIEERRYWTIDRRPMLRLGSDGEYREALLDHLDRIVPTYLPEAAAGITLSSGMDSTSVAAAVTRSGATHPLVAFTWIAPELPEADETGPATAVAEALGLEQEMIRADLQWTLSSREGLRTSAEGPFTNYYRELWDETYRRVAQRGLTTLLTGASGDHLFGGGGRAFSYPDLLLTGRVGRLVAGVGEAGRRSGRSVAGILYRELALPLLRWGLPSWRPAGRRANDWLRAEHRETLQRSFPPERRPGGLLPGRSERLMTLRDPLLPAVLENAGREAERYGIELVHPLVDHRLIELAAALPTWQIHQAGERKVLLRETLRGILPDDVVDLRGKIYPSAICHRGLRERERAKVRDLMTDMRLADLGLVDEARLRNAYGTYLEGGEKTAFWYSICAEAWLREHF